MRSSRCTQHITYRGQGRRPSRAWPGLSVRFPRNMRAYITVHEPGVPCTKCKKEQESRSRSKSKSSSREQQSSTELSLYSWSVKRHREGDLEFCEVGWKLPSNSQRSSSLLFQMPLSLFFFQVQYRIASALRCLLFCIVLCSVLCLR